LSGARQSVARTLEAALARELHELAMPRCRVEIRTRSHEHDRSRWTFRGIDEIEFFISPNPGEDVRPLARIASGGELSRVMLALRTLAITGDAGRTLIFDEVDAGIGGAAADAVGARLKTLADRHQVLCITHLPQIAARADAHFQIAKQVRGGRTVTVLNRLDSAGREHELARMIAGARVSAQVLASAREMINERRPKGETLAKGESETAKAKGNRRGA
jgi:DNA repair protein RecN (Recombination protein N)